jgi:HEPN domain-containing protein
MKPLTAEWVAKAEEDFAGATQLERQRNPAVPNIVCFHCQQSAEKYLKARLQEAEVAFPKTHDLEELLDLLLPVEPLWESLRDTLKPLTEYAVEFRYPGDNASVEEAKRALVLCQAIRETVRQSLGLEGPQTVFRVREKSGSYRVKQRRTGKSRR